MNKTIALERVLPPPWGPDDEVYQEHLERYNFASPLVKDLKVLDVACGSGFGSQILSKFASEVLGIDNDNTAIEFANSRYHQENLTFKKGDALMLEVADGSFDAVISFETIEHLVDQGKFLRGVTRVLKPKGMLIVSTPDREIIPLFFINPKEYHNPFHIKELSKQKFEELLSKYFTRIEMFGQGLYKAKLDLTYFRRGMIFVKPFLAKFLPRSLKNKLKKQLINQGGEDDIFKLESPNARSKYLIAICQKS